MTQQILLIPIHLGAPNPIGMRLSLHLLKQSLVVAVVRNAQEPVSGGISLHIPQPILDLMPLHKRMIEIRQRDIETDQRTQNEEDHWQR